MSMSSFRVATDLVRGAVSPTHEAPVPLREVFERGALITSAWDDHDGPRGVLALTGEDRGDVFEAGPPQLLDRGPDLYSPALLCAPGGRWLLRGWSWEARDQEWSDADSWTETHPPPRDRADRGRSDVPAPRRRTARTPR